MTAPRQVIAGRTHFLSRRCTQRQFLLRPDGTVVDICEYCLGEAADRYGVTVHAWIAMSNHQHAIVRDNRGNYPEFLAHLNKMLAKALNVRWGRTENLWASEQPNVVYLVNAQDRFDKLVYLLANPVSDDLVERVADWPGASSYRLHLSGKTRVVERPSVFFSERGVMPERVTLRAEKLDGFEHLSDKEYAELIDAAVRREEAKGRERRMATQRRVLGRKAVLRASHTDVPSTAAPRRELRPNVACRNPEVRRRELACLRGFRIAHRRARLRWCTGDRDVAFPPGTYRMLAHGVRCLPLFAPPGRAGPSIDSS